MNSNDVNVVRDDWDHIVSETYKSLKAYATVCAARHELRQLAEDRGFTVTFYGEEEGRFSTCVNAQKIVDGPKGPTWIATCANETTFANINHVSTFIKENS